MDSGRSSDATPLSAATLGAASEEFLDNSWRSFFTILDHAPALIDRCHPASSPWPTDAETLSRLADAVIAAEELGVEVSLAGFVVPQERRARAWPAIKTWLAGGRDLPAPGPSERTPPPPSPARLRADPLLCRWSLR